MDNQVFPTKGNLLATRKSLQLAVLGYDLLDRKRNILVREMMNQVDHFKNLRKQISDTFSEAYYALQLANITLGVVESTAETIPIDDSMQISIRRVMGVEIPTVKIDQQDIKINYDFKQTNSYFDRAYTNFQKAKEMIAMLSEVENSIYRLANEIKKTQKRANALQNIVIPQFKESAKYIAEYLEEKDREEFSRLKVLKSKNQYQNQTK